MKRAAGGTLRIGRKEIYTALLYVNTFFVVFTPVDLFGMKKLSLILLLIMGCRQIRLFSRDVLRTWLAMLGFWLTTLSIVISIAVTGSPAENVTQGYMGYMLLPFFAIRAYGIDYRRIFRNVLLTLAGFTVLMALLDFVRVLPMGSNPVLNWMHDTGIAYVGKHSGLPLGYMIFVKTSPLLVLLIPTLYNEKRYYAVMLTIVAIVISGTRANVLVGLVALMATILTKNKKNKAEQAILLTVAVGAIWFLAAGAASRIIESMFGVKASDDAVRSGILTSIKDVFRDYPTSLLTGSGYSSSFYNAGRQEYSVIAELSYWNLLRQVGLILFIPMMLAYLYPAYRTLRTRNTLPIAVAYIGYLFIAYTNPLLYSTTGILGLLYMYCVAEDIQPAEEPEGAETDRTAAGIKFTDKEAVKA